VCGLHFVLVLLLARIASFVYINDDDDDLYTVAARGFMAPGVKDHIRRSLYRLLIRQKPLVSHDL